MVLVWSRKSFEKLRIETAAGKLRNILSHIIWAKLDHLQLEQIADSDRIQEGIVRGEKGLLRRDYANRTLLHEGQFTRIQHGWTRHWSLLTICSEPQLDPARGQIAICGSTNVAAFGAGTHQ